MESLFLLIPIAMVFVIIAVALFVWSVKSGQFEDLDTEGKRILFERDAAKREPEKAPREIEPAEQGKNTPH